MVHLAGDTITYARLAVIVEQALDRPIERELLTVPDLSTDLSHAPDDAMRRYRAVFAGGRGMWWDKDGTSDARRGIAVTDAQGWLRSHLAHRHGRDAA